VSEPTTADDLRQQLAADYGTYVAVVPIDINGARAFNVGDAVPASHVERQVVASHQVARNTTKAGRAATATSDESKG
jgi:hypothetical protein